MQVPWVPLPTTVSQVGVWPLQGGLQMPEMPQKSLAVPAWQVPLLAAEQQPPLQACVELQSVVQAWVVRLQALPVGQSPSAVQPQTPLTH